MTVFEHPLLSPPGEGNFGASLKLIPFYVLFYYHKATHKGPQLLAIVSSTIVIIRYH